MTLATTVTIHSPVDLSWREDLSATRGESILVECDRNEQLRLVRLDAPVSFAPSLASFFDTLPRMIVRRSQIDLDEWSPADLSGD